MNAWKNRGNNKIPVHPFIFYSRGFKRTLAPLRIIHLDRNLGLSIIEFGKIFGCPY